jgi:hypothetical protein
MGIRSEVGGGYPFFDRLRINFANQNQNTKDSRSDCTANRSLLFHASQRHVRVERRGHEKW